MNAFLITTLFACTDKGKDSGGTVAPAPVWEEAFDTSKAGALSGVWGTGPEDVFIVGGRDGAGEVYHFDGKAWSAMAVPKDLDLLVWAYGFGPQDIYAVGVNGSLAHYDGTWNVLDSGTDQDLWGIWGSSPTDMWVVGGNADVDGDCGDPAVKDEKACIWKFDGKTMTPVALPKGENDRRATTIFKVFGVGNKRIAVGQRGLLLEYDGTEWRSQFAGTEADDDFVSCWGPSEDNIVCVGGRGNGRIATWDGTSWETVAPSALGGLNAVYMEDPDQAIIGGVYGWVGNYTPGADEPTQEDFAGSRDIHAMWGDGAGTVYGVGGLFTDPYLGVAFKRTMK